MRRRRGQGSLEKPLILGKIEGRRRRGRQRMRWLDGITDSMDWGDELTARADLLSRAQDRGLGHDGREVRSASVQSRTTPDGSSALTPAGRGQRAAVARALARDGVSREVPCSALKGETVPDSLPVHSEVGGEEVGGNKAI